MRKTKIICTLGPAVDNPDILEDVEKKVRANFAKAFEESLGEELPEVDEDGEFEDEE